MEINPGPTINLQEINLPGLKRILEILYEDEVGFEMPLTRVEVLEKINENRGTVINLAFLKAFGLLNEPPTQTVRPPPITMLTNLPAFNAADSKKWFGQIEVILNSVQNTDASRKASLLGVLTTDILEAAGVDTSWSFDQIKERIIQHFDDTVEQKLRKMLARTSLGDQKPSALLRQMQDLAQGNESIVKLRFMEILPSQIKVVLAALPDADLHKLAEIADRMMEQVPSIGSAAAGEVQQASTSSTTPNVTPLEAQVAAMTNELKEIRADFQRSRDRFRSHSRNRGSRFGALSLHCCTIAHRAIHAGKVANGDSARIKIAASAGMVHFVTTISNSDTTLATVIGLTVAGPTAPETDTRETYVL